MKKKILMFIMTAAVAAGIGGFQAVPETAQAAASNEQIAYNFLVNNIGFNKAAACGVLANIEAESDFNPNLSGDKGTSYGILQWHNGRYTELKSWCGENGYDYKTITGQLQYLKKELSANNDEWLYNGKTIYNYLSNKENVPNTADGAWEAGRYWCIEYERPANKEKKSQERGDSARNTYWPKYSTSKSAENKDTIKADASIHISGAVYPESITAGTVFTIKGTVSSQMKLTKVHAVCYDTNGKAVTEATVKPGTLSYKLADSALDNRLLISGLKPGKYIYTLEASNASKDAVLLEKTFTVTPKSTSLTDLSGGKKKITAEWKKQAVYTDGYQLQYATDDDFKNDKIVTVKKETTLKKTIDDLKADTKYYVRVRTYSNYKNKDKTDRVSSGWSKAKSVKTK